MQKSLDSSKEIIEILKTKLERAEVKASKAFEEKATEVSTLQKALKKSCDEMSKKEKDLVLKQKDLKEKEKIIQRLEHKCENLNLNSKNYKT